MTKQPHDHLERAAALDPAHSLLVQAPAGSGKTELLTDRILALLPTVQRPEEIVAITFTRKAAAEMHARVMAKLAAAEQPAPDAPHARASWELARAALAHDRRQGWQLLQFPARLSIQTIDAFCSGLTRRMPYLSLLGGAPRVAQDPGELYAQAARATLEWADDADYGEPVRELLTHLDVNPGIAASLLADMLQSRAQWLPILHQGNERENLEHDLYDAIRQEMQGIHRLMPQGWQHELPQLARAAHDALAAAGNTILQALADWDDGDPLSDDPDSLTHWHALAHLLLTKEGTPRKALNKNIGFPPGSAFKTPMQEWLKNAADLPGWADKLAQIATLPEPGYSDGQWQTLKALFGSLRLAAANLQLVFSQTGEVDFTEITQRALQALGSADAPSDLLLRMDARIHHLLIDEFQDTSQPQIDLLRLLTAGWQQGDGRTLFLVGDPMQSIYRFRKAEVALFLQIARSGVGDLALRKLVLSDNFRSQGGIVQWVNQTFSTLFPPADDEEQSAVSYAPSQAFKDTLDGRAVSFHPAWRQEPDPASAVDAGIDLEQLGESETDIVLRLVRETLAANTGELSDHTIAILVRARSHARAITRRLTQAGIPHRAVELTGLAQRPVVADLAQLARALAHPADRLAWLCTLRAPWCGLTLASLTQLVGDDHAIPVPALLRERAHRLTNPEDRERLTLALPILLDAGNASGALTFATWVEDVWRRLGGPLAYPDKRNAADAESFFRLLEEISPYGAPDPAALSDALQRLFAGADPDPRGRNVQIMTMHKAKGLQFDTVILPGLHLRGRADTAPLLRLEQSRGRLLVGPIKPQAEIQADPISAFLGRRDARRADFELDRLLYVAATRAKQRLHLVGTLSVDANGDIRAPSKSSLLGRLWPALTNQEGMLPEGPPSFPANTPSGENHASGPLPISRLPLIALNDLHAGQARRQTGNLAVGTAIAAAPSDATAIRQALRQAGHHLERATGELAHAWLEYIAYEGTAAWGPQRIAASSKLIRTQLSRLGLPESDRDAAHAIVMDTLSATLNDARGRWLLEQPAHREWRLLDAQGRQLIVDLALATEDGWLVVDYKTSQAHPEEPQAEFAARMRRLHAAQLRHYCSALNNATGQPARAALYFPRQALWLELDAI